MSDAPASRTFFITGVSTGLGRALARAALEDGHRVVGTLRDRTACEAFEALAPGRAFARRLDITETAAVGRVVAEVEREVGTIDVLVNNAGYGQEGPLEESPLDELRRQFEVNVFGTVAVIKAVLPHMRKRRAGRILVVTSMCGFITLPGLSYYQGSKFALEGITETLGKEVKPFGIHVTAVEPGAFRTDWAGRSMTRTPRSIADYDASFGPLRENRLGRSGNQPGDPAKAARAMLELAAAPTPPAHLIIGPDALQLVRDKFALLESEIAAWEPLTRSTNFDA